MLNLPASQLSIAALPVSIDQQARDAFAVQMVSGYAPVVVTSGGFSTYKRQELTWLANSCCSWRTWVAMAAAAASLLLNFFCADFLAPSAIHVAPQYLSWTPKLRPKAWVTTVTDKSQRLESNRDRQITKVGK